MPNVHNLLITPPMRQNCYKKRQEVFVQYFDRISLHCDKDRAAKQEVTPLPVGSSITG